MPPLDSITRSFCPRNIIILLTLVTYSHQKLGSGLGSQDEVNLVENLFKHKGYNPLIRPVQNLTDPVVVKFGMAMIQLISVDEKNQIMKSNVWLRMEWYDLRLQWDLNAFKLNDTRIPADMVWNPEVVLLNNADGNFEVSFKCKVVVQHNGLVYWIPPSIYRSSCTMDVSYFPFDEQLCRMEFASWIYNNQEVVLDYYDNFEFLTLNDYVFSGTWDIVSCPASKKNISNDEDPTKAKSSVIFLIKLRRKPLFFTVNMIVPCVLISFLSVCVLYLPVDAGEKMTMCISVMLALVVFILLLTKILPPTSLSVPLIAKYLLFAFIMNIISVMLSVIIVNWHFRTPRTHRMPSWIRKVFIYYLPKILCMKRPQHEERWQKSQGGIAREMRGGGSIGTDSNPSSVSYADLRCGSRARDVLPLVHAPHCPRQLLQQQSLRSTQTDSTTSMAQEQKVELSPEMHKAVEAVRFVAAHLKNEDDYSELLEDWRYIAMVFDRLQLYIFLAITIGGTMFILLTAPHLFETIDQAEIKKKYSGL